jgi:mono/diheme cytochrome c family protein
VEHWFAPNLTASLRSGLGTWSEADIVSFLQTGTANGKGTAVGPMAEVVHNSLSRLREADLKAIAVYLKSLPPGAPATPSEKPATRGARLYVDNCMACHQAGGVGVPGAIPALKGNGVINADDPADLMKVVLQGVPGRGKYPTMPAFADRLSDGQIADVLDYVRSRWGNSAPQNVTPSLVGLWRGYSATGPDGTEAVQRLECPRISTSGVLGTVAMSEAELEQLEADLEGGGEGDRIGYAVRSLQEQHPDWTYGRIGNALVAAYCPVVANSGLDRTAKLARLRQFTQVMREVLTRNHVRLSLAPEQAYPTIPGGTRNAMLKANPRAAGRTFLCPPTPASERDLVEVVRVDLGPYGGQLLANDFFSVPEIVAQVRRQRPDADPEHLIPASALAFCPLVEADTGSETHAKPDYSQRVSTWMRFAERVARASLARPR